MRKNMIILRSTLEISLEKKIFVPIVWYLKFFVEKYASRKHVIFGSHCFSTFCKTTLVKTRLLRDLENLCQEQNSCLIVQKYCKYLLSKQLFFCRKCKPIEEKLKSLCILKTLIIFLGICVEEHLMVLQCMRKNMISPRSTLEMDIGKEFSR